VQDEANTRAGNRQHHDDPQRLEAVRTSVEPIPCQHDKTQRNQCERRNLPDVLEMAEQK
jgi:hypothetical protein